MKNVLKKSGPCVGIIPGPTEPKGNINTYLMPLVDDVMFVGWTQMEVSSKHVY